VAALPAPGCCLVLLRLGRSVVYAPYRESKSRIPPFAPTIPISAIAYLVSVKPVPDPWIRTKLHKYLDPLFCQNESKLLSKDPYFSRPLEFNNFNFSRLKTQEAFSSTIGCTVLYLFDVTSSRVACGIFGSSYQVLRRKLGVNNPRLCRDLQPICRRGRRVARLICEALCYLG
jgi:hypothetical protein